MNFPSGYCILLRKSKLTNIENLYDSAQNSFQEILQLLKATYFIDFEETEIKSLLCE